MKKKKLKPKRLKKGQQVGLIAPAGPVDENRLQIAIKNIESLGLKPFYRESILDRRGYLAGKDEDRLNELHRMFGDSKIDGIWCIRGGYGCTRLLERIDYKLIRKNPKVLIGYSDITALLQAIYKKTGLIGFHGPVAVSEMTEYTKAHFQKILFSLESKPLLKNASLNTESTVKNYQVKVIRPGKAIGKLVGGNLSLVSSLAGTKFQIPVKNKILLLEDIGEKPYRIDRMLTQLRQSSDLNKAAAIVLGIFDDCEGDKNSLSLMEVLDDHFSDLKIPVIYGMSFGHIKNQMTLPIGIKAEIDTQTETIQLLETFLQ